MSAGPNPTAASGLPTAEEYRRFCEERGAEPNTRVMWVLQQPIDVAGPDIDEYSLIRAYRKSSTEKKLAIRELVDLYAWAGRTHDL